MADGLRLHDYSTGEEPEGETWDTEALRRDFEVTGFSAPYVVVKRRSDGAVGSLQFTHSPRVYWGWAADDPSFNDHGVAY
jgi:hypothetical protein